MSDKNLEITGEVFTRTLPPPGRHVAIFYKLVLLGTIDEKYQQSVNHSKQMMVGIELVNTNHVFDPAKGPQPFVHEQQFNQSMGPKSRIRKLIQGWRGSEFTPGEAKAFNFVKLMGVACEVNLIKKTSAGGKDRIEIDSILMLDDGTQVPALRNEQLIFTIPQHASDWNQDKFAKLGKWWQDKIKGSDEYKALALTNGGGATSQPTAQAATVSGNKLPF